MSYVTKILGYFIKDEEARELIAQKVSFDIHALTTENAIADADELPFYDASASCQRKTTWQNVKAKLKGYFDTVYLGAGALTGYATQAWVNAQGFITSLVGYATEVWVQSQGYGTYSKPTGGIPKTDLASAVQTSLGMADTALQSYTETDPTVPAWAKASSKPSYTASEVGALPDDTVIPSKTSDLVNDSGFLTQHQSLAAYRTAAAQDEIDATKQPTIDATHKLPYAYLSDTPTIPDVPETAQATALSIDTVATSGSNNLITSGAVYAIAGNIEAALEALL